MNISDLSAKSPSIQVEEQGVIYTNPLPQLWSRKAYFPSLIHLHDGSLLTSFVLGEAMESADQTTVLYRSEDEGSNWHEAGTLIPPEERSHFSDSAKLTVVSGEKLAALGYRFDRSNPNLPVGNPATGGLLPDEVFYCQSEDNGRYWSPPQTISTSFTGSVEASAPLTVLADGVWAAPIANFLDWEGNIGEGLEGRLLRSEDQGATWSDSAVTMCFPGGYTAIWEQRLCEYLPGHLAVIAWVEDLKSGEGWDNHIALSFDGGRNFGKAVNTGIHGQAANLCAISEGLVLSLHCMRKGVSEKGILATITDLSRGQWDTKTQCMIWHPRAFAPSTAMPEVFSAVRFGQPSALYTGQGTWMVTFWCEEDGEASIRFIKLKINVGG